MADKLVADLYAVKAEGYVEALFAALESAGVQYRTLKSSILIKVYSGKTRVNVRTIGHALSRVSGESISGWLDRVAMDPAVKAIGIEVASSDLTPAQVKHMHKNLAPSKFNDEATKFYVSSFTFIAPPTLAKEVKQFARTVEHVEAVALPVLHVPAGHVEPPITGGYIDSVGDAPTFAVEPLIPIEEPVAPDDAVEIVEIDSLDALAFSELKVLFKKEFRYNAPLNIRRDDLKMLIDAKRDSSF